MASVERITLNTRDQKGRSQIRWRARWRNPDSSSKERRFRTKAEAERYMERLGADLQRGEYVDPSLGRVTVAEWADTWLSTKAALKPKTLEGYDSLLRVHVLPRFGKLPLHTVRPEAIARWLGEVQAIGLSASRARQG